MLCFFVELCVTITAHFIAKLSFAQLFGHAMFYLAALFCRSTFYLAELFCQIAFSLFKLIFVIIHHKKVGKI